MTYPIKNHSTKPNPHALVIANLYASGKYTTAHIAATYGISTKQVQRIARNYAVIRTNAESNKLMAPLKAYHRMRVPEELKAKRKQITQRLRFQLISAAAACANCGAPKGTLPFHVDHIDNDATNNELSNLQVLCAQCNIGKSHLGRYGTVLK